MVVPIVVDVVEVLLVVVADVYVDDELVLEVGGAVLVEDEVLVDVVLEVDVVLDVDDVLADVEDDVVLVEIVVGALVDVLDVDVEVVLLVEVGDVLDVLVVGNVVVVVDVVDGSGPPGGKIVNRSLRSLAVAAFRRSGVTPKISCMVRSVEACEYGTTFE